MTDQITIKLNKKRFAPILQELSAWWENMSQSNSELTGKALFFLHCYLTDPIKGTSKTRRDIVCTHLEKHNITYESALLDFEKKYRTFLKNGTASVKIARKPA